MPRNRFNPMDAGMLDPTNPTPTTQPTKPKVNTPLSGRAPTGNPMFTPSARLSDRPVSKPDLGGGGGDVPDVPVPVSGGGGGGDPKPDVSAYNYQDAEYNAQVASLNRALEDYETGAQQTADRYGQDFRTGVQKMGYRPTGPTGFGDVLSEQDPNAKQQAVGGQWDLEGQYDPYSAAAKGTRGIRDDFAARGTLQSSDFAQNFGEFQNRLDEQLDSMNLSKARFGENLQSDIATQRANTEESQQATGRAAQQRAVSNQMQALQRAMMGG
jgi:hypothetical protein